VNHQGKCPGIPQCHLFDVGKVKREKTESEKEQIKGEAVRGRSPKRGDLSSKMEWASPPTGLEVAKGKCRVLTPLTKLSHYSLSGNLHAEEKGDKA